MKKGFIAKSIAMMLILLLLTSTTYATTQSNNTNFEQQTKQYIQEINNIRKQFLAIAERGYYNHLQEKPNKENIATTQLYIIQIEPIRKRLQEYREEGDLDKFQKINIGTLIATTQYLEAMGQNLIDYLAAITLQDQYGHYNYHVQINQFIVNVLGSLFSEI